MAPSQLFHSWIQRKLLISIIIFFKVNSMASLVHIITHIIVIFRSDIATKCYFFLTSSRHGVDPSYQSAHSSATNRRWYVHFDRLCTHSPLMSWLLPSCPQPTVGTRCWDVYFHQAYLLWDWLNEPITSIKWYPKPSLHRTSRIHPNCFRICLF